MTNRSEATILAVDDDDDCREIIRWTLTQEGFNVIEAANGTEAIQLVKENPDLVILDVNLPDINGFDICRQIKADPATSLIPILLLSGIYLDSHYKVEGLDGGADSYLTQPVEPSVLIATVKSLLRTHQAEAKVHAVAQQWQATFDAISDGIFVQDRGGRLLRANRSFSDIVKKQVDDTIGCTCHKLVHGMEKFIEGCPFVRMRKTGCRETIEIQMDGRYFRMAADPVQNDTGSIIGAVHTMSDITEHRKLENQLRHSQKIEAVGTLTRGVAHEFNNILTAIIGYANLIYMKLKEDDPLRIRVEQILHSSERAANFTQSLLKFSRKQEISPRPVNLNEIVKGIKIFLIKVIGEDIELRTILTETDTTILADHNLIEQVLINLATNARDAMPEGGLLVIETSIVELDEDYLKLHNWEINPGKYALISLMDGGVGMDEKTRERVFEPFFTTKEMGKGTGLGLSIVYGIIRQHKGYINVYSEPDKGTTFKIFLPLVKSNIKMRESILLIPSEGRNETILVAEDDLSVRNLIMDVLERYGYEVIEAIDGEDAIKTFMENKEKIQLLLLDLVMPRKGGREAYEEMKKIKPDVKAIFTSGYPTNVLTKKNITDDDIDFISKPISPNNLLKKLRNLLDK